MKSNLLKWNKKIYLFVLVKANDGMKRNWRAARSIKDWKSFNAAVIGYMLWAHPFPYSFHLFASLINSLYCRSACLLFNKTNSTKQAGMKVQLLNWNGVVVRRGLVPSHNPQQFILHCCGREKKQTPPLSSSFLLHEERKDWTICID